MSTAASVLLIVQFRAHIILSRDFINHDLMDKPGLFAVASLLILPKS